MSLLGQFLAGVGMAQAVPNGLQAETEAAVGHYKTPAANRSDNMGHCLWRFEKCHDLHSFGMLINGKAMPRLLQHVLAFWYLAGLVLPSAAVLA